LSVPYKRLVKKEAWNCAVCFKGIARHPNTIQTAHALSDVALYLYSLCSIKTGDFLKQEYDYATNILKWIIT